MKEQFIQWMERPLRMPVVGVDVSDRSVKYMKISAKKEIAFEAFGEAEIPQGAVVGGEIKQEDSVLGVIKECVARERRAFGGSCIAVSLPEEKSFLRPLRLKDVKPEDVGNAIRWEIEGQIPLPADEILFDYEMANPVPDSAGYLDVILTAFPKAIVASYLRVFKGAGLVPAVFELESQAIARTVLSGDRSEASRIIIDMGRTRVSFIIVAGGGIAFTTTIPAGGELMEENLIRDLRVTREEAVKIKKEVGLSKDRKDEKIFSAFIPVLDALADELQRTIRSYQNHAGLAGGASAVIAEILLTGGDANLLGLDTYLAATLQIPCRYANPFAEIESRMKGAIPPLPRNAARAFTSAIGLALRDIR